MSDTTLILLGAGNSTRFGTTVKKQWLTSHDIPLWLQVAEHFERMGGFKEIIIVSSAEDVTLMQRFASYRFIVGGESRQASLTHALQAVETPYVLVSDIARCCIPTSMIERIMDAKGVASCIVPTLPATDTLYLEGNPIDREQVRQIQTPQLSVTHILKQALTQERLFSDESSAIASLGESIHFVEGSPNAHKLTRISDLAHLPCIQPPSNQSRVGFGLDTHPFESGKPMRLCGVTIDVPYGFKAHSDGDVAIHALIDALLGAAGMGDIGELYPDTDNTYSAIDSTKLLSDTIRRIKTHGFVIGNVDMTIVAQAPKLLPYRDTMQTTLASLLGIRQHCVNIKATTSEKLGFIGRKEGVTVHAVATLTYFNWKAL